MTGWSKDMFEEIKNIKTIMISENKLDEIKQKFHEDAWKDKTVDAEAIDAYISDFVTEIKKAAEED